MIQGRDVVLISSIDWQPLWQAHQEIASRLGEAGNRVVFVENTGVRSPGIRDAGRVLGRLVNRARSVRRRGFATVAPNVRVYSPLVLPPFGSRWRRALNRRLFLPAVERALRRLDVCDPVVLTFLPTDTAVALCTALRTPKSVVVYYCGADFTKLVKDPDAVRAAERRLVAESDLVLLIGPELGERFPAHPRTHVLAPGVDTGAFRPETTAARFAKRPVVGYVGGLHRHVDLELLAGVAERRPDWSFVFVGPVQRSVDAIRRLPNVHLVGARPHHELAACVAGFDVCIVPYLRTPFTETVVPTKVGEYLAMAKPVVSTALPAVGQLAAEGVVTVAESTPAGFAGALATALGRPSSSNEVARRRAAAARLDWAAAVERLSDLIEAPRDGAVTRLPSHEAPPAPGAASAA